MVPESIANAVMIFGAIVLGLPVLAIAIDWYREWHWFNKRGNSPLPPLAPLLNASQRASAIRVVNAGVLIVLVGFVAKVLFLLFL